MDGLLAPDLFSLETFVAKRGLRSNALYPYPPVSAATIWNNPLVTLELFYGPNCSSGMCFPEMTARRKNMEDRAQCLAGLQEQPTASIHHHLPLWPKHRQGGIQYEAGLTPCSGWAAAFTAPFPLCLSLSSDLFCPVS